MESFNVYNSLLDIQARHLAYFYSYKKNIADCIVIYWKNPLSIHIRDQNLPVDIKDEIEKILRIKS